MQFQNLHLQFEFGLIERGREKMADSLSDAEEELSSVVFDTFFKGAESDEEIEEEEEEYDEEVDEEEEEVSVVEGEEEDEDEYIGSGGEDQVPSETKRKRERLTHLKSSKSKTVVKRGGGEIFKPSRRFLNLKAYMNIGEDGGSKDNGKTRQRNSTVDSNSVSAGLLSTAMGFQMEKYSGRNISATKVGGSGGVVPSGGKKLQKKKSKGVKRKKRSDSNLSFTQVSGRRFEYLPLIRKTSFKILLLI